MKIFAFTDCHCEDRLDSKLIDNSKEAELIVCAGDFTTFGRNIDKIMKDFSKFNKPVLIIHGNHEEGEDFKKFNISNVRYLHKKFYIKDNFVFFGYGGGGFSERYTDLEELIPKIKEKSKGKKLIVITHAPVYGTTTDFSDWAGHVGSKSALKLIKETKPALFICGHMEENSGQIDNVGKTIIINPGDEGKLIEI